MQAPFLARIYIMHSIPTCVFAYNVQRQITSWPGPSKSVSRLPASLLLRIYTSLVLFSYYYYYYCLLSETSLISTHIIHGWWNAWLGRRTVKSTQKYVYYFNQAIWILTTTVLWYTAVRHNKAASWNTIWMSRVVSPSDTVKKQHWLEN